MTNKEFAKSNKNFLETCEMANIKPTKRQASKFRRRMGKAFKEIKNKKQ